MAAFYSNCTSYELLSDHSIEDVYNKLIDSSSSIFAAYPGSQFHSGARPARPTRPCTRSRPNSALLCCVLPHSPHQQMGLLFSIWSWPFLGTATVLMPSHSSVQSSLKLET
jgi:hypothetical protein